MFIDVLNLVALFLAIWHSIRRLDAAKLAAEDFPSVDGQAFAHWRGEALRAHAIVLWSCFGYILVDLVWKALAWPPGSRFDLGLTVWIGRGLFLPAAVGAAIGLIRVRRAEVLRISLGIEPGPGPDADPG